MNLNELKKIIPVLMRNNVVPFLWGSQGIGKTQTIKQIAKEHNLGFVHLHLATQEVGDVVGLLMPNADGTVKHARPQWFPTDGTGIVFLDELNRAHPDVINAMFSLITEKTIHTHKLPPTWYVVAAGNYQDNSFNVTDTSDAAWMSRFCHIDVQPSQEEFTNFLEDKNGFQMAAFIRTFPDMIRIKAKECPALDIVTPDNRAWADMVLPLEIEPELDNNRYEIYSGIVGKAAAAAFLTFKQKEVTRISGRQVLAEYSKVRDRVLDSSNDKEARFDLLNSAVEEILLYLESKTTDETGISNFQQFLLDIPLELGLKVIKRLSKSNWVQRNVVLNNREFVNRFKKSKL